MIDCRVQILISVWSGTGTVTVPTSVCRCITNVVSALPDHLETVLFENAADFWSGEDAERTHAPLQSG